MRRGEKSAGLITDVQDSCNQTVISSEHARASHFFHTRFDRIKTAKGLAPHARFGGLLYA
jgi:hypothetical protein